MSEERFKIYSELPKDELNRRFINGCFKDNVEKVKYLLTSPKLPKKVYVHIQKDRGFQLAYNNNSFNVLQFLIFNMDIEKTEHIEKYLKENPKEKVENMFNLRELNKSLGQELKENNSIIKKVKL